MTATPAIRGGELWLVDLSRTSAQLRSAEAGRPRLSADDRERLAATANSAVRGERELSWIALRLVLARIAGDRRHDGVPFQRTSNGKPFIADAALSFSLSHSSGFALIAAAAMPSLALGVDIQASAPLRMTDERVERMIAAGDRLAGNGAPHPREVSASRDDAALQAFVRIEAVAKATGLGLAHVLARVGVLAPSATRDDAAKSADEVFADAIGGLEVRDIEMPFALSQRFHAAVAASRGAFAMPLRLNVLPDDWALLAV